MNLNQEFLRNPVSKYIGDISYSLYLVHWPVIVFVAALMDVSSYYYLTVVALAFGLAIGSYHLVENPLRRADAGKFHKLRKQILHWDYRPSKASQHALVGASCLVAVALVGFVMRPRRVHAAHTATGHHRRC